MNFETGSAFDGPYEYGYESGWHWSKNKGSHASGRDFFWVHWEISDGKPNSVKLHVESPKAEIDPKLNRIKQEMAQAFLSPRFRQLAAQGGYEYIPSRLAKPEHIAKYKSTQPFRIQLADEKRRSSHRENIAMINGILGAAVEDVVSRFRLQLDEHFVA